jgi:hypothetical protein
MSAPTHPNDDMWRTPTTVSSKKDEDKVEETTGSRMVEEHAVEDSWYQVLRRKLTEHDDTD